VTEALAAEAAAVLTALGFETDGLKGGSLKVTSPITGETIADLAETSVTETAATVAAAQRAFLA
jgi:aldehyde dehydrogenase (NAD+)